MAHLFRGIFVSRLSSIHICRWKRGRKLSLIMCTPTRGPSNLLQDRQTAYSTQNGA